MGLSTFSAFKTLANGNNTLREMTNDELKTLQKVLLSMVEEFDDVCQKNNINYMLGGGSCLGAVRHKGFIPWDDDMDINMTREDYLKLRKVFKSELEKKYWLQSPEDTKDYALGFVKLRKKGTTFRGRDDLEDSSESGICIDIFIIENTYDFFLWRYFHGFLSLTMGFLLSCRNFYKNRKFYLGLAGNNKKIRTIFRIKVIIGFLLAFLPADKYARMWNTINGMCHNNHSKYVTVPVGRKHFFGEMYLMKNYCNYKRITFDRLKLPVPIDENGYMKNLFGSDYMRIPKKTEQEKHVLLELDFGDNAQKN